MNEILDVIVFTSEAENDLSIPNECVPVDSRFDPLNFYPHMLEAGNVSGQGSCEVVHPALKVIGYVLSMRESCYLAYHPPEGCGEFLCLLWEQQYIGNNQ